MSHISLVQHLPKKCLEMFNASFTRGYEIAKLYGIIGKFTSFLGCIQTLVDRTAVFVRLLHYLFGRSYDEMVIRPIEDLRDYRQGKQQELTVVEVYTKAE